MGLRHPPKAGIRDGVIFMSNEYEANYQELYRARDAGDVVTLYSYASDSQAPACVRTSAHDFLPATASKAAKDGRVSQALFILKEWEQIKGANLDKVREARASVMAIAGQVADVDTKPAPVTLRSAELPGAPAQKMIKR